MAKLTDTQLVILNTAAKRDSRLLLPFSRTLKLNPSSTTKVIRGLLGKQLIEERPAAKDEKDWRSDDDGRYTLVITHAGLQALGIEFEEARVPSEQPSAPPAGGRGAKVTGGDRAPKKGGKLDGVVSLMQRIDGATIADLQHATGWQAHSVRAALTGLRKQGTEITRSKNNDGVTIYTAAQA